MIKHKIRLSLRFKLLFVLVSLPLISLGLYLLMATDLFQKDKLAYVFDSSASLSRALATQTRMELQGLYENTRGIVEAYSPESGQFSELGQGLFDRNNRIHAVILERKDSSGQFKRLGHLLKPAPPAQAFP
ncbi:MAG: hypothetical protein AB7F86_20500, partial [Bdellovibrionales bacterium]